jgi:hypothetical protein
MNRFKANIYYTNAEGKEKKYSYKIETEADLSTVSQDMINFLSDSKNSEGFLRFNGFCIRARNIAYMHINKIL